MFCPDGYLTLYEIYAEFGYAGYSFAKANPPSLSSHDAPGFKIDTGIEFDVKAQAYQEWLFQNFLSRFGGSLFASLGNGVVLRLSEQVTYARNVFSGPFPEALEEQEALIKHVGFGLAWVNYDFFRIDPGKSLPLEEEETGPELLEFADMLAPLRGCLVCWKPDKWPYNLPDLVKECASYRDSPEAVHRIKPETLPRGRPPKGGGIIQLAVRNTYLERLRAGGIPHMQREYVLNDAIAWAKRILGEDVSRSTMQRYLAPVFDEMDAHK